MGAAVMVGRGAVGTAGVYFFSTIIISFTARSTLAQKGDGCGSTVLGPSSGTLSSPGHPQTYPNHTVCEWEILVAPGSQILFRFGDLDIEEGDCQVSYLRIYNGIGPKRTEMVKYCGLGTQSPELVESSGNQVTVQFMSGAHQSGRGFILSYSTTEHQDLITCLDKGIHFTAAEYSKFCPAGCLTAFGEISGTVPHGYRDSSFVCQAAVHAGVVSDWLGGQISVVNSKGIPHYEGSLANNVTSVVGTLSNSLFTFKTSGCYGTLGLEAGVVRGSQLSASSVWEWSDMIGQPHSWGPAGARLKRAGLPWAAGSSDQQQWLQVDLKKEKRITGITTTGSTLSEYPFYVSAYRLLYSNDGQHWSPYREADYNQDKVFQGNTDYLQEVRNNFIPPIEARYMRINPAQWYQRIALKLELLGCQIHTAGPRIVQPRPPSPPKLTTDWTLQFDRTTFAPDIRNTTMPPHSSTDMELVAVLVPVLAMVLTGVILTMVFVWHWRNRRKTSKGPYDLTHWDRTDWWKSMKQFLPYRMAEGEESVRYSTCKVGRLREGHTPRLQSESAEYAQPLVNGVVSTLGQRSTFKPEEGGAPGMYDIPVTDIYHAYAEPLPASGAEYATPIVIDIGSLLPGGQPSVSTFSGRGPRPLLQRTDSSTSERSMYDTPKPTPTEGMAYQVPQSSLQ